MSKKRNKKKEIAYLKHNLKVCEGKLELFQSVERHEKDFLKINSALNRKIEDLESQLRWAQSISQNYKIANGEIAG